MPEIERFLDALASSSPTPGGGAAAAYAAAMGAALVGMAARLTSGRRFQKVRNDVAHIVEQTSDLRRRAESLAEDDQTAYQAVADAQSMPRATDEERARRSRCLQEALKGAARPPLELMHCSLAVTRVAHQLATIGNPALITDTASGSLLATAAFRAARLNVEANLHLIRDREWVAEIRGIMQTMGDPAGWDAETQAVAQNVLRAESG
ncbi:MAG TPA: cyclodeaminase/cyclohydrolase family protein [Chloroflexota bacterium]|nr:cyclodeaminase/cyclohydrolase family protein [Chloroflexota bacterium]